LGGFKPKITRLCHAPHPDPESPVHENLSILTAINESSQNMDEIALISLHDGSDRTIIVGEKEDGQRIYKVSSLAMSMASPIWKAMFNPASGFRESNPDVAVEFPEDDPNMMLILLRIAHLQFNEVPKSITFACLRELAVLCDKYDTVGLVQPFIENWMGPWALLCLESGYEDWLFIAWTFGCQQIFGRLAESLVLSASDGDYVSLFCEEMPPEIIGETFTVLPQFSSLSG
jgi:hypothetical protein